MEVLALILGTYALSASLLYSDGAWGLMYRIRNNESVKDFGLLECYICTSFWIAALLTFVFGFVWWYGLIAWGATVIVDKILISLFTK